MAELALTPVDSIPHYLQPRERMVRGAVRRLPVARAAAPGAGRARRWCVAPCWWSGRTASTRWRPSSTAPRCSPTSRPRHESETRRGMPPAQRILPLPAQFAGGGGRGEGAGCAGAAPRCGSLSGSASGQAEGSRRCRTPGRLEFAAPPLPRRSLRGEGAGGWADAGLHARRGDGRRSWSPALVLGGGVRDAGRGGGCARAHTARAPARPSFPARPRAPALDGWLRSAALLEGAGPVPSACDGAGGPCRATPSPSPWRTAARCTPGPRRIRLWVDAPHARRAAGGGRVPAAHGRRARGHAPPRPRRRGAAGALPHAGRATQTVWLDAWRSDRVLPDAVELTILPAPEAAADPAAGGLPRVLRMPVLVPLRWNPDASDVRERSDAAPAAGP